MILQAGHNVANHCVPLEIGFLRKRINEEDGTTIKFVKMPKARTLTYLRTFRVKFKLKFFSFSLSLSLSLSLFLFLSREREGERETAMPKIMSKVSDIGS